MLTVRGSDIFNQNKILHSILESMGYDKEVSTCISSLGFYFDYWSVVVDGIGFLFGFIDEEDESTRLRVPGENKIIQVSSGKNICLLLTENGVCWKYFLRNKEWVNISPIFSNESTTECNEIITKVCTSDHFQLVVSSTGKLYSTPPGREGKAREVLLPGVIVVDVACGREHALLLTDKGQVFTCGNGKYGQLGHGGVEDEGPPRELMALAGLKVTQIAAGSFYSCAITEQGDLYMWGMNNFGQLGFPPKANSANGDEIRREILAEPRVVDWPQGIDVTVKHVSCGSAHTVAFLDDCSLWGCGWNGYRQLSDNSVTFYGRMVQLEPPVPHKYEDIKKVVCGWWNTGIFVKT